MRANHKHYLILHFNPTLCRILVSCLCFCIPWLSIPKCINFKFFDNKITIATDLSVGFSAVSKEELRSCTKEYSFDSLSFNLLLSVLFFFFSVPPTIRYIYDNRNLVSLVTTVILNFKRNDSFTRFFFSFIFLPLFVLFVFFFFLS